MTAVSYTHLYYGYRVHPISGEKNYHTGVDIGMPEGTEILAGHDGTVTLAGNASGYGLCVAIEEMCIRDSLEHRVSEHSAATESLKKTLDEQTARMKAIKRLYDSSAAFQSLKPVYDGLQKIKFEKPRAKYKACLLYTSRCV